MWTVRVPACDQDCESLGRNLHFFVTNLYHMWGLSEACPWECMRSVVTFMDSGWVWLEATGPNKYKTNRHITHANYILKKTKPIFVPFNTVMLLYYSNNNIMRITFKNNWNKVQSVSESKLFIFYVGEFTILIITFKDTSYEVVNGQFDCMLLYKPTAYNISTYFSNNRV